MLDLILASFILTEPDFNLLPDREPVAAQSFDLTARDPVARESVKKLEEKVNDLSDKVDKLLQSLQKRVDTPAAKGNIIEDEREEKPPILAYFSASWCVPCHQMLPVVQNLESRGYRVQYLDYDVNKDWVERFRVTSVPTVVVVKDDGTELGRIQGVADETHLLGIQGLYPDKSKVSMASRPEILVPQTYNFPARVLQPEVYNNYVIPVPRNFYNSAPQGNFFNQPRGGFFRGGGGSRCGPGGCH
jgi:thioredoxin 1